MKRKPIAVDLFCGVGGLSKGLSDAGLTIAAGIDNDPACEFAFKTNIDSSFRLEDVGTLESSIVADLFPRGSLRVLAGCAPCQPFSRYGRSAENRRGKWSLLADFARIACDLQPEVVTMENVPEVQLHPVFDRFRRSLETAGYRIASDVLYCPCYGVPQRRKRLVLLASRLGDIQLPCPSHDENNLPTVRDALASMRSLEAGESDPTDKLHRSCKLSPINLKRIRASKAGGTWRDWPKRLRAKCHKSKSGETYPAVYGRMEWDMPAPTITTQFFGYGNGRFGHPEQDRAISLREGAILQSFPPDYKFVDEGEHVSAQRIGKLIGNAVPVRLGEAIGKSIVQHFKEHG